MRRVDLVVRSGLKILYWKLRYGTRLQTSLIQGFDRVHMEIYHNGRIILGQRVQNRGELYLICDGEGELKIGSHVHCNTNSSITCMGKITIGEYCKFGNNLVIVDHDHNYKNDDQEYLIGEVSIGDRVWIGANCTILKGAHIGNDCVIAAGSVVKGDVPDGTVFYQKRQNVVVKREETERENS